MSEENSQSKGIRGFFKRVAATWGPLLYAKKDLDDQYNFAGGRRAGESANQIESFMINHGYQDTISKIDLWRMSGINAGPPLWKVFGIDRKKPL
ncbi:MAG: hypothetical protein M1820_007729 [Bogoriella megaspora]|nr:MAG: hypothetical protein M1820_007729 [Bogoriella megaspora]